MNNVELVGVVSKFTKEERIKIGKEILYKSYVAIKRDSGTVDKVPIIINEEIYRKMPISNSKIHCYGYLSSYNYHYNDKTKLLFFVYVERMELTNEEHDLNRIEFTGYSCKNCTARTTPLGRKIADLIVATHTTNNHSDYIPCICWGKSATEMDKCKIGTELYIIGRFQSRVYKKPESKYDKTAYEVSIQNISKITE